MKARRVLYAEDDDALRVTLTAILRNYDFDVVAVSTVAEALCKISSEPFDLLISDLNLGEAGDGFTLTSAMRRVQPHCPTVIVTGYPAFEAALAAIRSQVDDFFVKPADIKALVETARRRMDHPEERHTALRQTLADFLAEHRREIINRVLRSMRNHPRLSQLPLEDLARVDHLEGVISELIAVLQGKREVECNGLPVGEASRHGRVRKAQGYTSVMLVDDLRLLDAAVYELVSENLLTINLSCLIPDLGRLNQSLESQLQDALHTFQTDQQDD